MGQLKRAQERQEETSEVARALDLQSNNGGTESWESWWNVKFILKVELMGSADRLDVAVRC